VSVHTVCSDMLTHDANNQVPGGLVGASGLLTSLWPDESSRPSLRWIREMQARRVIPFLKIGRKVLFEPQRVLAALRKLEVPAT
jgi:hypothetical protein